MSVRVPALRFRTKVVLGMLLLFGLTVALLFAIDTYSERRLLESVDNTVEAVTKAIEVASDQAQLSAGGKIDTQVLEEYAEKLRQRGVREIQILNPDRTVIATSRKRPHGRASGSAGGIAITGTIGEADTANTARREYRLTMPILSGNQKVGYVSVDLLLSDYDALISRNFLRRVMAVTAVFALGLVLFLVLARNFTRPLGGLAKAAARVAEGNLDAAVTTRRHDDVGALVATWNEMLRRLRAQRELEARLAAAERQASLAHVVSGVAHEIRNPLNTISLAVDYLRQRFAPSGVSDRAEFQQTTAQLQSEIARLNGLITDLLDYGKPLTLRPGRFDGGDLLREVARELEGEAAPRGTAIEVSAAPFQIEADRGLLKAAFLNVALNAIQVMEHGGRLAVFASAQGGSVTIRFDDTGPGIPEENLAKIFEPYFSTRAGGVGLGLAMTRKIIADHGGTLTAENLPRGGSRFEFRLPLRGVAEGAAA